ncbi:hypothetical protein M9Y10_038096 [Tritrichomonas musculus]|uniref:Thioredoxin domain-containing protein n=1 Tax=Tritrichomonas musculus TaxID=1915356 RepID=A0ABR2KAM5_9EUKA
MIFILISFITSSTFVPYTTSESLLLVPMNMTQILEVIKELPMLVVLLHDPLSPKSIKCRQNLIDSIPIFQFDLVFAELDARNSTTLLDQLDATAPHILFYTNGTLWGHYSFPSSETTLLYLLNLFAEGTNPPIADNTSLYKSLGTSYYSLIYPANEKIKAHNIHRYVSSKIGFVDLIPFNLQSKTFDPDYFYFFRIEDLFLSKIHKDDVTITNIISCAKPLFKSIAPEDFISNTNLTFAISVNGLTSNVVDILEKVALSFPDIVVGFAEKPLHNFLNFSTSGTLGKIPCISVLNTTARKFYTIPQIINDKLHNNDQTIIDDITNFLSNLPEPVSISEPIKSNSFQSNVTKLVGMNHDDFVLNNDFDSIVLYYSRNTPITRQFIRIFSETADFLIENNVSSDQIRFGMINTTCNAASFPLMPVQPHIEIYPKENKTDSYEYFGQANIQAIIRFIKDHASCNIPIIPRNSTEKEDNTEIYQIYSEIQSLNEKERKKAERRLEVLAAKLKLNLTDSFYQEERNDL